ncbi:TolB family protein [Crenothrix polyspora]|uniref:Uncharacterized protein n=1 Tax=Crenothrix polyspora TaxID=360316 RepID=A0A1R4HCY5_9GAMM|nr:PD40 domain-containing protein [Crenothrix polyspora]SJM94069.1 conserved exported hypothetical protein [Crenothrix polyspora]
MKTLLILPIIVSSLMASFTSYAQCTSSPVLQSDSKFPQSLRGRLIYHSYSDYGSGSSNLFLKNFRTNTLVQLNQASWNIEDPMNAHFSPNGRYIVFMGKQNTRWNIFIWKPGSSLAPINLTNHTQDSSDVSEDPKFSPDGNYIVYKNNADIVLSRLTFANPDAPLLGTSSRLTNNGYDTEESMPYFSTNGKSVFYSQGAGANSDIYRVNFKIKYNQLVADTPSLVTGKEGLSEYYPVTKNNALFFVSWKDALTKMDQIYWYLPNLQGQPVELSLNDCNADNSDPAPIDNANIFFSSNRGDKFYRLYVGNIYTGKVWSMSNLGVNEAQKHQLGASYTNTR